MAWSVLLSAIGLVFVFEGVMIAAAPRLWRKMIQQMVSQQDRGLRIIGLVSMLIGLAFVCIARDIY